MISHEQAQDFRRDGFVLVEGLFSQEEVDIILESIEQSQRIAEGTADMPDAAGRSSKISIWRDVTDDVAGLVST